MATTARSEITRNAETTLRGGADYMGVLHHERRAPDGPAPGMRLVRPLCRCGGTARVVQQAFVDPHHAQCLGVHFYDEPGLTW